MYLHTLSIQETQPNSLSSLSCKAVAQTHGPLYKVVCAEGQVKGETQALHPRGIKGTQGFRASYFFLLPVCSRSSAGLAVISAPLPLCLGHLPGLLLFSSGGTAQLSKGLFFPCPSQHFRRKDTKILASKAKKVLVTVPNLFL